MKYERFAKLNKDSIPVIRRVRELEMEGWHIIDVSVVYKQKLFRKELLSTIIYYEIANKEWQ